jgi:hypothetical protein
VVLLLCGFACFFVVQVFKLILAPRAIGTLAKIFLAAVGSFGTAAIIFPHRPSELVVYGAAGVGLNTILDCFARFFFVAADWIVQDIVRKTPRR